VDIGHRTLRGKLDNLSYRYIINLTDTVTLKFAMFAIFTSGRNPVTSNGIENLNQTHMVVLSDQPRPQ
jgi:hypothetical protein